MSSKIPMSFIIVVFTVLVHAHGQNEDEIITIEAEPAVIFNAESYKNKICNSEPTCGLINSVTPKDYTTLKRRNCMCDAECTSYGDCCLDSKFYDEIEQKENFQNFHCSFLELVYMKVTCPKNYNNDTIRSKCEKSTSRLESNDVNLIIPVTDVNSGITYGNKYCAQCHGEETYHSWNVTRYCSVQSVEKAGPDDFQQNYLLANFNNDTTWINSKAQLDFYKDEQLADLTENGSTVSADKDLINESVEATKNIKFDHATKDFYSIYNEKNFTCSYGRAVPEMLETYLRPCKKFIYECKNSSDQNLVNKCHSYTSFVFDGFAIYKNKECASCNGVTKKLEGCFSIAPSFAVASNIFSTNNKVSGGENPCNDPALKEKFC